MKNRSFVASVALLCAALTPVASRADVPGDHPGYLHSLSDLRAARWMIQHRPADSAVAAHEAIAVRQIDAAIDEIRQASINDGKNIEDHPPIEESLDHPGRLHAADDLLHHARNDIMTGEDRAYARGLQHRTVQHIDDAIRQLDRAIDEVSHHM